MKHSKRFLALALCIVMLVLAAPIGVNAATTYSYTITGKEGYVFTVYKLADMDPDSFALSNFVDSTQVQAALTTKTGNNGIDMAAVLAAADTMTRSALGTPVGLITDATPTTKEVTPGAYYVRATVTPASVVSVTNSVFLLPYTETDGSIRNTVRFSAGNKVRDNMPAARNLFTENLEALEDTAYIGQDVSFTIKSTLTGSIALKLNNYTVTGNLSAGWESGADKIASVKLTGHASAADQTLTNSTDYTASYTTGETGSQLKVELSSDLLASDDFYGYSDVEIVYTAKLSGNAVIGYGVGNTSSASTTIKNYAGVESTMNSGTLKVCTFALPVKVVDGNTAQLLASGISAVTLYSNANCSAVATNGSTQETVNGIATFKGLKAGTYYLMETAAPSGYNINSSVFTVAVSDNGTITVGGSQVSEVTIQNYPLTLTQTGGSGTFLLMLIGTLLIICAGVLFGEAMKKKASR